MVDVAARADHTRCLARRPQLPEAGDHARVLSYAVRKRRLSGNPLSKLNLPEGWSAPPAPEDVIDPRSVGGPELVADMLTVTSYLGRRQGPRFVAFYGCMFYAMMRPSEVIALTRDGCHLTGGGWGRLIFADASPAAGRDFTDDGRVHEDRGLKGRARQSSARRATRNVPIPPDAGPADGSEPAGELVPDDDDREDQK